MTEGNYIDHRPWGSFEVLLLATGYQVKRITVLPGQRLSLQYHRRREEHWFVVCGVGLATRGEETIPVASGVALDIPLGTAHRMQNTGDAPLVFIEIQRGDYLGEDDIVRLTDDYGRTAR